MSSDSLFNLFNQPQKRSQPSALRKQAVKPEKSFTSSLPGVEKPIEALLDPEIEEILMQIQKKQKEIVSEAEKIQSFAAEVAKQEVGVFFNNPKNFSPEEWQIIQQNRAELEEKARTLMGKDPKKKVEQRKLEKQEHARKGKTLGARRNWIQM